MTESIDKLIVVCYYRCMSVEVERKLQPGDVLSVREAAKEIGAHYVTLYRWITANKIVYVTFGRTIFIPVLEVERLKRERALKNGQEIKP